MAAALAALLFQVAAPAAAQNENSVSGTEFARGKAGPPPRTPDGKPDFQGYWQSGANINGQAPNNNVETHPPSFLRSGGKSIILDPPDGKLPYQDWALKERDIRRLPQNSYDDPEGHCFPSGVPRQMYIMPYQILEPPGHIVMLYEYIHARRVIPFNKPHLTSKIRSWEGDSVAHWDGDVLVVDTTNNNGKTWLELSGNFTSDAAHQVERFTMVDANTITYRVTVDDPKVFTRPWTAGFPIYRIQQKGMELLESACHEDNRDLEHLRAVKKAAERRAKP
jgi:hypothetical protein